MSAFNVRDQNLNHDPIVVSDDKPYTPEAPLATELVVGAVNVQQMGLGNYRYDEVWLSAEQIVSSTFMLRDIQSSNVKSPPACMRAPAFGCRSRMTAVTWSGKWNLINSMIENELAAQDSIKVVKEGFKIISFGWASPLQSCTPAESRRWTGIEGASATQASSHLLGRPG